MNHYVLLSCLCVSLIAAPAAAQTGLVPIQGVLADADGKPIEGEHRLTFILHDQETDESALFTDDYRNVELTNGNFIVYLGSQEGSELDLSLFADNPEIWLETIIDGTEVIQPRTRLGAVPYAGFAQYCGEHTHDWSDIASGDVPDDLVTESELEAQFEDRRTAFAYHLTSTDFTFTDAWQAIPEATVSITLSEMQPVLIGYSLSVAANDAGTHCNVRFVVDDVALGNATYGNAIAMGTLNEHWQTMADFTVRPLAAGTHTVRLEARRQGTGSCGLSVNDYSAPTLFAMGIR